MSRCVILTFLVLASAVIGGTRNSSTGISPTRRCDTSLSFDRLISAAPPAVRAPAENRVEPDRVEVTPTPTPSSKNDRQKSMDTHADEGTSKSRSLENSEGSESIKDPLPIPLPKPKAAARSSVDADTLASTMVLTTGGVPVSNNAFGTSSVLSGSAGLSGVSRGVVGAACGTRGISLASVNSLSGSGCSTGRSGGGSHGGYHYYGSGRRGIFRR